MNYLIELLKAFILGVVQGITEWLPISSTGHMILVNEFLHLQVSEDFLDTFLVIIQLGSILAVVVLYWSKLWPCSRKGKSENRRTWSLWFHILVACIPAAVVGLLFDDIIHEHLYGPLVIAIALIVYGIGFLIVENAKIRSRTESVYDISYQTAAGVGAFQMLALIPGTSRSGSTILGGRLLGCSKEAVAEFSFFMAIPVMAGASALKLLKLIIKGYAFSMGEIGILAVGCITAFVVSVFAIKFLMNYIRKNDFKAFGVYRIVLGILVLGYFYVIK